jgi:hypothetical protein
VKVDVLALVPPLCRILSAYLGTRHRVTPVDGGVSAIRGYAGRRTIALGNASVRVRHDHQCLGAADIRYQGGDRTYEQVLRREHGLPSFGVAMSRLLPLSRSRRGLPA